MLQLTSPNLKFSEGFNFQWDPLVIQLTCHIQLEFFLTNQPTVPLEVHYAYEKRSSVAMRHYSRLPLERFSGVRPKFAVGAEKRYSHSLTFMEKKLVRPTMRNEFETYDMLC